MKIFKRWYAQYNYLKQQKHINRLNAASFNRLFKDGNSHLNAGEIGYQAFLRSREYSVYSQNGEDGIIAWVLKVIGAENHNFVEFGIGDGSQCNSRNLVENHGWNGLFIEGDSTKATKAGNFYEGLSSKVWVENAFITKENINPLIQKVIEGDQLDLLSIDIDGNDYWIWEAINAVKPRMVIIEYNSSFGKEEVLTIPYQEDFARFSIEDKGWYHGVSFSAALALGKQKGYSFVGADSHGVNMFFVRNDLFQPDQFRVEDPLQLFYSQSKRDAEMEGSDQLEYLKKFPLTSVEIG